MRYFDAWKRGTPASSASTLQVRLDVPGGVTYAPDSLNQHNYTKRQFFVPKRIEDEKLHDFEAEIAAFYNRPVADNRNFVIDDEPTPAQQLAADVRSAANDEDMDDGEKDAGETKAKEPTKDSSGDEQENKETEQADDSGPMSDDKPIDSNADGDSNAKDTPADSNASDATTKDAQTDTQAPSSSKTDNAAHTSSTAAPSTYAPSIASVRTTQSQISNASATTVLSRANPDGLSRQVRSHLKESTFKYPASIGNAKFKNQVWNAPTEVQLRSVELLSGHPEGRDPGTQWETVSGYGTESDSQIISGNVELISKLFVPDSRPWHPLRLVRRSDPRQVLLLCAGTALNSNQAKAAELALNIAKDGKSPIDMSKRSLASYFGSTENTTLRGGLGVVICPTPDLCNACDLPISDKDKDRVELNFSRRLERPDYLHYTSRHRAALRSAVAALEYIRWEEEGFDKIVIATHHSWIVQGITRDIWEWRRNNWRLTRECALGGPGDDVPDRDLWELLDHVVRQYEEIDCNCRFWHIVKDANLDALRLAEIGALKNDQQPATVRWTRRATRVQERPTA
ncbi:hypothetical protein MCUN1_002894 [Malassezia cuniculi]|uniref:Uncharacterized protein n=1 Tax=Malassezia cuniculi TaxID=948313 RepID=A0AAF0F0J4_9BASI|nr:hypothetical protein MCUN1_002894 [Malassezia cuniculi]